MSGSLGSGWRKKVWDATPTHSGITSQFDFVDAGGLADVEEGAMKHQGVQSGWHKVSGFGRRSTDSSSGIGSAIKSRGFGYSNLQKKFVKEMRLLSKLRHPCITTIMGAVISPHCEPMLIMECKYSAIAAESFQMWNKLCLTEPVPCLFADMELGSLFDLLHNESLTLEGEILHPILLDIARGIRFLHAAQPQVIHCDLKAQNILVDSKLRAKVSDFGLSTKQNFFGSSITGTPYWMSPELLRGETSNSAASDVYAFGILLYEVFSRKEPYEGENPSEVLELVADDSIGKRPPVPPHCTTEATNLMKSCLLANPVDRPTAKEIDIQLRMFDKAVLEPNDTLQRMGTSNKRDERTQALLWQVFPKHVAAALRDGQKVSSV